jgi:Undecaprenyl-phosphate glucose phosphotransferase
MLQALNSSPACRLQDGARMAVTGDNAQMTQEAVHALDGQPTRATSHLSLRAVWPQLYSAKSTSRQRWAAPQAVGWVVAIFDFITIFSLSLLFTTHSSSDAYPIAQYGLTPIAASIIFVTILTRIGGYRHQYLQSFAGQVKRVVTASLLTAGIACSFKFQTLLMLPLFPNKLTLGLWGTPLCLFLYRYLYCALLSYLVHVGYISRNIVIVGGGIEAECLIRKIKSNEEKALNVRGLFDDRKSLMPAVIGGVPVLGTTDDVIDFVRREIVDEVLIALPLVDFERIASLGRKLQALAIDVRVSIEPLPGSFRVRTVDYLGDARVLDLVDRPLKGWSGIWKIIQDTLLGLILLICAGPLMLAIAVLIKLDSQGPVFFIQERFGLNNSVIRVLKFRTMHLSCGDPSGQKRTVRNDPRVTRVGRILRKFSLDELPQLINVLCGDMSLVGPRPHAIGMMAGDQFYHDAVEDYPRRHRVKPGITGWAQVNGSRGEIDTLAKARDRVHLDLHYIDHWSLWLDIKILFKTVSLLLCKSAY